MSRDKPSTEAMVETFDRHRSLLFSIAYRMLGSVADTEDVLQEAYLRWQRASEGEIRSPKSYLSAVVTRLCIDKCYARREEYVGSWLPEPLPTEAGSEIADVNALDLDKTLSMAFLVLLESLSPIERAVFLLREVFDYDYVEISQIVGKSEVNCRQIARRAHQSVAARRPRFESSPEQEERLVESFIQACTHGDMENLVSLLAEDITLWTDGGGKARAAEPDIRAREGHPILLRIRINGRPGVAGYDAGGPWARERWRSRRGASGPCASRSTRRSSQGYPP